MADSKIFSLEGKALKLDTAEDIAPHIAALKSNEDVEEVRLLGNTLGIGASEELAKVLETKKKLQVANLADIFTSRLLNEIPPALDALLKALLTLPNLHTVNLNDNAFGLNTQAPLVAFLSEHVPLRHLYLNNNGLGPAAGVLVADALSTLAEKKEAARKEGKEVPNLETVVCGRNRLENGSMAAWAKTYSLHKGVRVIRMVQNGIRQEGITHLIREGLSHLTALEILDLQDNTFTAMAARALGDAVPNWTSVRELGVSDCLLSARGGIMLGKALDAGKNQKLEILRLQYNEIDAKGIKALADALSSIPNLRRIELNGNKFDEDDPSIGKLRETLEERREKAGAEAAEGEEDDWGIDDLDELEEESEEEEDEGEAGEDEEEGVEVEEKAAREVAAAQQAEAENVPEEKDDNVEELADMLAKKAEIK